MLLNFSNSFSPFLSVFLNFKTSFSISSFIFSLFSFKSGYTFSYFSVTTSTSAGKVPSSIPIISAYRTALRNKRRNIYPLSVLDGITPSETINTDVLIWSAIILQALSLSIFDISVILFISGANRSVLKTLFVFCITIASRSSPAPVSTFFCASLPIIFPSFFSYSIKTSFHTSTIFCSSSAFMNSSFVIPSVNSPVTS